MVMLANWWTTIIGSFLGMAFYLKDSGMTMPTTKSAWVSLGIGLLLAALGVVAKDATTGSKPPAAQ